MFLVELTNFGTFREFDTFAEAQAWMVKTCFEATMSLNGTVVATFSPITGFHRNPAYW